MLEKGEAKACPSNACKRELGQGPVNGCTIRFGSVSYAAVFMQRLSARLRPRPGA